ncbi:fumarylacetoacetate hydrolase family protein [Pseudoduganella umbonata]|uniref:Fumarylacetoacetate hydrolase family protein n=1 Tax=Pseudoduganella umbonata TaxID=864828 RepID=A0A4P8HND2_9BURK|nr:fumarylacetoacetate hydrolase family protein [Pseudoduganella umbonata]MBB3224425.1 fumarylpyruvate hydrolase [Pseudoduganella umbonata]QCP11217.1 fumarylacetoacetate hydrolase family protein [Pseudoduganella umbonata]
MTDFIFPPHQAASLAIDGTDARFPVRRVYCVGRNYAGHAREMGSDPSREPPFFFTKPGDAAAVVAVAPGTTAELPFPPQTNNFHHECELVVAIGKGGADIAVEDAAAHIFGYAVGFDMTRRDLQNRMKDAGRPWEIGKAFDFSAPVGTVHPAATVAGIDNAAITLQIDGATKQSGHINEMIWSIAETIANLSTYFTLQPGDLIFTGTPEGVGAVQRGQTLVGHVDGLSDISVRFI